MTISSTWIELFSNSIIIEETFLRHTFLALEVKEISASAGVSFQHGNSYLHSKQALLVDIDAGGMKGGVIRCQVKNLTRVPMPWNLLPLVLKTASTKSSAPQHIRAATLLFVPD